MKVFQATESSETISFNHVQVRWLILRRTLTHLLVGIAGALAVSRLLIFAQVSAADPTTFVSVAALFAAVPSSRRRRVPIPSCGWIRSLLFDSNDVDSKEFVLSLVPFPELIIVSSWLSSSWARVLCGVSGVAVRFGVGRGRGRAAMTLVAVPKIVREPVRLAEEHDSA